MINVASNVSEFIRKLYKPNDYGVLDIDYIGSLNLQAELEALVESCASEPTECKVCGGTEEGGTWLCHDCHQAEQQEAA
jgi:hypothetical protein